MDSSGNPPVSGGDPRGIGRVASRDATAAGFLHRKRCLAAARFRRRILHGAGLTLAVLAASCGPMSLPLPDPSHPASPQAAEAAVPEPATILGQPGAVIEGKQEAAPEMQHGHGMMHGGSGGTMQHGSGEVRAGRARGPTNGAAYVCPMHPDVRQDAPGRCPRCGMVLVRKTATPEQEQGDGH